MKRLIALTLGIALLGGACNLGGGPEAPTLLIYSGRSEELVGPVIEAFEERSGIEVSVKYGDSAELAALLLEEGDRTPADVFFSQDAGALGAVVSAGLGLELSEDVLAKVDEGFKDPQGRWVGTSGRARVVVAGKDPELPIPNTIEGFMADGWKGRLGWPPTNASFQAFVTGMRLERGEEFARQWLETLDEAGAERYPSNTPIVHAVGAGEIDAGFVNHYYALRILAEQPDLDVANYFLDDIGSLINVAGVLKLSDRSEADEFIAHILSEETQAYFVEETFEYGLIEGSPTPEGAPPLADINTEPRDLTKLSDLESTLDLLRKQGLL